jgi:hypothetical protein
MPVAFLTVAAVVICVAWSQGRMIGGDPDGIGTKVFGLAAFWAALTVLAGAAFSAIDLRPSLRRTTTLGLFVLPAAITVIGLAIGRDETTVVGIFLLAAVACAALLPPASQLTQQQLLALPLIVGAGISAIYPVAIALARPSLNGLRSSGATLPVTFAVAVIVAIAASSICAVLIAYRRAYPEQGGITEAAQRGTPPVPHYGAPAATHGATAAERQNQVQARPPLHARPSTAVEPPRPRTARDEDEDQPGAQSRRSGPLAAASRTSLQELAGHHHALDLVRSLVDLGNRGPAGSFRW